MKLATALAERSDIQNRINTISVRLDNNAKVQEGDVPAEDTLFSNQHVVRCWHGKDRKMLPKSR